MSPTAMASQPLSLAEASTPAELQDRLLHEIQLQRAELSAHQAAISVARASAPQAATRPAAMPAEDFSKVLLNMQIHYGQAAAPAPPVHAPAAPAVHATPQVLAVTAFKLPETFQFHPVLKTIPAAPVVHVAVGTAPHVAVSAGDAAVDAMVAEVHSASLALIQKHASDLLAAAKTAEATRLATAAWLKQMEASRASLKATLDQQLKAIFDKASAVGNAHPDQRPRVLAAANHGSALIQTLFGGLVSVTHAIGGAVDGAAHAVSHTVSAVGSWASGAVKSVGNFLHNLF